MRTFSENKRFAFLVIADDEGVRRVPIGMISERSRVISMEYGDLPAPPFTAPAVHHRPISIPGLLLLIAASVGAYKLGGAWALIVFALIYAATVHIGRQSWNLAQNRPSQTPGQRSFES